MDELIKTLEAELEKHKAYLANQREEYAKHAWRGFCGGFEEALDIVREWVEDDLGEEPPDIDSDLGFDPFIGQFTDEC